MKGCWGPEFEPSVEEIMDYPMISLLRLSQFAFSSELAFRAGGFPYSVEHMAGEGQPAQAARPNIVRAYGACAVCQCVLQSARRGQYFFTRLRHHKLTMRVCKKWSSYNISMFFLRKNGSEGWISASR